MTSPGVQLQTPDYYSIPRDWVGQTAFLICGGPSVTRADVQKLYGRRVVVVNSSYMIAPWADAVVFSDFHWWHEHSGRQAFVDFKGEKISLALGVEDESIRVMWRTRPPLAKEPFSLAIGHTTVTAALDYIVHKGAARIGILGLDGKDAPDGRMWHHEPHPETWRRVPDRYKYHGQELRKVNVALFEAGVLAVNLNLDSAYDGVFVKFPLDDFLEQSP